MMLYDTHAHFEKTTDIPAVLTRARAAGVVKIMAVGGSAELNDGARRAAKWAAEHSNESPLIRLALGYDRDQIAADRPPIDYTGVAAVGEIGLDFYYDPETAPAQERLFAEQLEHAAALKRPVSIHTREADDATLGVLDETGTSDANLERCPGVIHCFTGTIPFCRRLLDRGFMISISGIVTFRAAENVREIARYVPNDRLLIETDAPYLAPIPMRGKPNESAFIQHTAAFLATTRGVTPDILASLTKTNAESLFG